MGTYGFHGLHGRALPIACGVKARRPELDVWVATGDGDCCSIGAGHWIHAIRYNMDLVVMLFDNNIYGLTKKQTSPTTEPGQKTNTHPRGAWLPALDPITATLGMTNASFVAQTVDFNPPHLYATLKAAYEHKGTAFVRILQRCPTYTDHVFQALRDDPDGLLLMNHEDGIEIDPSVAKRFNRQTVHDPGNMAEARALAERRDMFPIGLFFKDVNRPIYDDFLTQGLGMSDEDKLKALNAEFDRFAV
jgi:2-oxoglutarate ferredoxin oxidoreductase subunit beta